MGPRSHQQQGRTERDPRSDYQQRTHRSGSGSHDRHSLGKLGKAPYNKSTSLLAMVALSAVQSSA